MASLSNINGLFDVHSTGAILFSNTHGTSGQILKSNGNAAPTWVDASTVIGGPYLPLTGGTLTGPLSGTSATFSGNIQLGGTTPTLNFYKTSNADILANIKVETDAGSGGKLTIQTKRNGNTAIDALVIDDNQKVGIGTDSPLTKLDIRNGELTVRPSSSGNGGLGKIGHSSNNAILQLYDSSGNEDVRISTSLSSYFNGGNVGIGTVSPDYKLSLRDDSTSAYPLSLENNNIGTAGVHTGIRFGYAGNTYQKGAIIFESQDANGRGKMYFAMEGTANSSNADETDAKMTIDYEGNVGISTNSPATYLQLGDYPSKNISQTSYPDVPSEHMLHITAPETNGHYGGGISFGENAFTAANIVVRDAGAAGSLDLCFGTGSFNGMTERMRINNSGDVGIGTTPETAGPTWRTLFIGASATIVSRQAASGYDSIFANNYYVNSSNQDRVRTTGPSSRMFLDGNNIRFQISPSNSSAPSWSEIMRIDDSGNVGIGTDSPVSKLDVNGGITSTGINFLNQSNSYNNITPGITGYGNVSMDTSVSYYDTGKNVPTTVRGIVWTGKHYIVTHYSSPTANFYDNNFVSITNPETASIALPQASGTSGFAHGAAWDGRYLYTLNYNPVKITAYDLDNGTSTATIVMEQATSNTTTTYGIEYAEGHLYTCADGKVSKYKVEGKTITHVFTSTDILGGIEAQAITYDGSYLWFTQNGLNAYKVSLDCVLVATITTGLPPNNVAWAWNGQNVASVNHVTGDIYIVNTAETRFDTEKFLIMGGNVGIGTDSPTESLEVMKDGGAIIRLHDPGNNSWKLKADTDFHIYDDSGSDYFTIKNAGQVGIGSTAAASRLQVNGVIQNQNAHDDPTFTVSDTGMSLANGGTLQFTQGFVGTSSSGDTVVFRYNSVSWKSWSLEFIFTSTGNGSGKHVCSGNIGGYNNNSSGYNSNFTQNFGTPISVSFTNVGQNNVITFTGDFGIHLMCTMRYSQSGGDGAPTSARASLTYNS